MVVISYQTHSVLALSQTQYAQTRTNVYTYNNENVPIYIIYYFVRYNTYLVVGIIIRIMLLSERLLNEYL